MQTFRACENSQQINKIHDGMVEVYHSTCHAFRSAFPGADLHRSEGSSVLWEFKVRPVSYAGFPTSSPFMVLYEGRDVAGL